MLGQGRQRDFGRLRQGIARRGNGGHERLAGQFMTDEIRRIGPVRSQDREIDEPFHGVGAQADGVRLHQLQGDARPFAAEVADDARHDGVEGGGPGKAHAQLADLAARGAAGGLHRVGRGLGQCGNLLAEDPARLRQLRSVRNAVEQLDADFALQIADLLGKRGLADAQMLSGAGEVALLGHGQEIADMPKFHRQFRAICFIYENRQFHILDE